MAWHRREAGAATEASVATQLQALEQMSYHALREAWRRWYRVEAPPRLSAGVLRLGVAWKIQEQAYGGLDAWTRKRLQELGQALERDGTITRARSSLKPGSTLIRSWNGTTHTVRVEEEGFTWQNKRWRSLSSIAREITGARWSGPRFFGLVGGKAGTDG